MTRTFSPKRMVIAALICVVGTGGSLIYDEMSKPGHPPSGIVSPVAPAPVPEPVVKTDLEQVRGALGPFETIVVSEATPTPETHAPAVLMLNENGSTEASTTWTVPFDATSWQKKDAFMVKSLSVDLGYVTIGTGFERTFVVKANQPFIIATQPGTVCLIDAQGVTWQLTTARAEALRQHL